MLRPTRVPGGDESARCLDARGHEAQLEAHRLIGVTLAIGGPDFGRERTVSLQGREQCLRRWRNLRRYGESLGQLRECADSAKEDVTRAACGGARRLGVTTEYLAVPAIRFRRYGTAARNASRSTRNLLECAHSASRARALARQTGMMDTLGPCSPASTEGRSCPHLRQPR